MDMNNTSFISNETACCSLRTEAILVPILFTIIVILGCLGNGLVIIVVIKNRTHHKNTTNLFILNLALADILFLVFCVPFHAIIYATTNWPFGEFMCKFVHLVQYTSMVASVMTLVAMALDRYLAVGYPLHTKHIRTPTMAFFISILIWALSFAMAFPWLIFYTVREYEYGSSSIAVCADDWGINKMHRSTYFLLLFIVCYLIPLISICVLTILMIRNLWSVGSDAHYREGSLRAKRKVTRLVIVVVIVFALCWLPNHIIWLWTNFDSNSWKHTYGFYYFKISALILSYANSCMNPIIYAFLSTQFKKGFNRALHMNCHEKRFRRSPHNSVRFSTKMSSLNQSGLGPKRSLSTGTTTPGTLDIMDICFNKTDTNSS